MNILILSRDPAFFQTGQEVWQRHLQYLKILQAQLPGSTLKVIAYTPRGAEYRILKLSEGLELYPTRSLWRGFMLWNMFWLVLKCTRSWKPHVITTQTAWEEAHLGWFFARMFKAKFLPQLHFDLLSKYWLAEHWLNGCYRLMAKAVLRHADAVRVVSQSMKDKLITQLKLKCPIFVAPVGVPFAPHDKAQTVPALTHQPTILFVGRLVKQKNLELWIDVAQQISKHMPQVQFVWAGEGDQKKSLLQKIAALNLDSHFHLLGNVPYAKLPEIYAAADVFLLTSDYEGNPRVVMEAMWAGIPVVASPCTGVVDSIQNERNGYVITSGQPQAYADKVLALLNSPSLAKNISQAALEFAQKNLNRETLAREWVQCWINAGAAHG